MRYDEAKNPLDFCVQNLNLPLPIGGRIMENNSKKIDDISAITVSSKVLSEIIGVTERRVRQLGEEGIFVRAAKGRYKLAESIKNYILALKISSDSNNIPINDDELNLEQEKAKKERVNRLIAELKLAKMKGEVHSSKDVENVMTDMLSSFKSRVMNLPSKVSPILTQRDTGYIKDYLTNEVLNILTELSDYNPDYFHGDDYIDLDNDLEENYGEEN